MGCLPKGRLVSLRTWLGVSLLGPLGLVAAPMLLGAACARAAQGAPAAALPASAVSPGLAPAMPPSALPAVPAATPSPAASGVIVIPAKNGGGEAVDPDGDGPEGAAAPPAGAASSGASGGTSGAGGNNGQRRAPLVWRLDVDAPAPLDRLLRTYLDLARFQAAAKGKESDQSLAIRRSELRRLVVSAPEQARALLEAQGHFNAEITTSVSDEVPGQPVVVRIAVQPGPLTRVSKVQFVFEGELDEKLSHSDPLAQALLDRLEANWALEEGEVFRQADWSAAKNATLALLRAEGYPTASWSGTSATVDAQARTARLFLVADSGPAFAFGDIRVEGLKVQPASAVINLAPFHKGDPYSERQLLDWQERIQKLNLFDDVFVTTGFDPAQAKSAPVLVQLHELPLQTATTGIGISSNTGPRVSLEHLHRNVFGLDWQSKTKLQLGRKESTGQLDLTSLPWPGQRRGLISLQGSKLVDTYDAVTVAQDLKVGVMREGQRLERTDYVEYQRAQVRSDAGVVASDASALSATAQWIFRDVDSQVLPTKGSTSLAQLTGGRSYSTLDEPGFFGRLYTRVTWYKPLPSQWYSTVRGEWGQVIARDAVSVPDTQLFRAGGDDSVRGYAYRSLGVWRDGVVVGGKSLTTASVELAHPLLDKYPSLWGAVFVDAGDAADRFSNLQPKVGYGAGVRWRSPVGPLRLDLAYGTEVQRWRVHFSVGISL